ncbi:MAG: hypothetical protein ACRDVP_05570 [Acidimicrobiales bacterium]
MPLVPEAGAQCGNAARWDLRGGPPARAVPTATRFGNSTRRFAALDEYVVERMALLLSKRHGRRGRGHGLKLIIGSGNRLGLERLTGTIDFGRPAHAPGEGRREAG